MANANIRPIPSESSCSSSLFWITDLRLRSDLDVPHLFRTLAAAGFDIKRSEDGRWGIVPSATEKQGARQ